VSDLRDQQARLTALVRDLQALTEELVRGVDAFLAEHGLEVVVPVAKPAHGPGSGFTPEQRKRALTIAAERGVRAAALELGCSEASIYQWRARHLAASAPLPDGPPERLSPVIERAREAALDKDPALRPPGFRRPRRQPPDPPAAAVPTVRCSACRQLVPIDPADLKTADGDVPALRALRRHQSKCPGERRAAR